MVVLRTSSTVLFASLLLFASPALAQDDEGIELFEEETEEPAQQEADSEAEEEDGEEEEEDGEEEVEDPSEENDAPSDTDPSPTDPAPHEEPSAEEQSPSDEPTDRKDETESAEPATDTDRGDEPAVDAEADDDTEPIDNTDELADDEDDSPAPRGMAFAPAYADPDPGVRVIGAVDDDAPWTLDLGGYIRSGFTYIQADEDHEIYGRNDGFVMSDARLTTRGQLDNGIGFVFTLDAGSRLMRLDEDSPVERLAVQMTDTYVYYAPFEFLEFNLGQFKAPFDAEDLISTADLLFINRSVANRGVQGIEGFNVRGMSQDRQLGLQARGTFPFTDAEQAPAVSYAAAVANGNGPNQSLNENTRLASYGRLVFHYGDLVAVGGSAFRNDGTFGDPPNRVDRLRTGFTGDVQVDLYGVSLFANVVTETRNVPDIEQDPETQGLGYQFQIAYEEPVIGLQPAYRFAFYDRTFDHGADDGEGGFFEHEALTYHTLGVNYNARDYPLRLMANYTIALEEEGGRQLDNDRFDMLLQLQW